jgi:hypothetical protein
MPKTTGSASSDSPSVNPAALREAKDRGARLYAEGKLEAALAAFQQVVKAAPQEIIYRHKVAEVLQRLGRKSEATAEYLAEAEAWARTGWLLRAIAACKVILQFDPEHSGGKKFLAELYDRRDRPRSAPVPVLLASAEKPVEAQGGGEAQPPGPMPLFSALSRAPPCSSSWMARWTCCAGWRMARARPWRGWGRVSSSERWRWWCLPRGWRAWWPWRPPSCWSSPRRAWRRSSPATPRWAR